MNGRLGADFLHPKPTCNQSTESADGGGFLNFYKPLDYISSVLSFCSIFLDM